MPTFKPTRRFSPLLRGSPPPAPIPPPGLRVAPRWVDRWSQMHRGGAVLRKQAFEPPPQPSFPILRSAPRWVDRWAHDHRGRARMGIGGAFYYPIPPAPAPDLLAALIAALLADAAVSAALGDRVVTDVMRRPVYPYVAIVDVSRTPDYESPDEDGSVPTTEMRQVQLSVFHSSKESALVLSRAVADALNDAELTYAGGYLLYLRLSGDRAIPEPMAGPGGLPTVYHRALTFRAITEAAM